MEVASLAEAKWNKESDTRKHSVSAMLRVILDRLDRGEITCDHAIVCLGSVDEENAASTEWYQAGKLDPYAQLGLLSRVHIAFMQGVY